MIKIKVFGLMNAGTTWIKHNLIKNFFVKWMPYEYLGWKHRVAPSKEEMEERGIDKDVLFLLITRNPYNWIISMGYRPYHQAHLVGESLDKFVEYPYLDYRNIMIMWNKIVSSYIRFKNFMPNTELIRIEDMWDDTKKVYDGLAEKYDLDYKLDSFSNFELAVHCDKVSEKNFERPKKEEWIKIYDKDTWDYVTKFLNNDLLKTLNYEVRYE